MKNNQKSIVLLLILLLILVLGIGVTYAIFKWTSSNSNVTFNVEGCYVTYDAGSNISGASFGPALSKDDTTNVISKKITLSPECSGVTANLTLKVDNIATELKDPSFIYELYTGSTLVSSGNFSDATIGKTYTLLNTKTLAANVIDTYILYIYIDGTKDNANTMGDKSFSFTLGASGENAILNPFPTNAVNYVNSLEDGSVGDSGSGVYKVEHDAIAANNSATGSEIPATTDYRYYGPNPNNYICLDNTSSTCPDKHLYRIIGSIYEENSGQNLIKVIKATPLTDGTTSSFSWDYKSDGTYNNIWATVTSGNYSNNLTSGSEIMKLLNSGLWWNGTSGTYYNNSTTATTLNFTNYKLSDKAKNYINTSRYYLGGYNTASGTLTDQIYNYERGTNRINTERPLYWDGNIALLYPSDYGYAAGNTCTSKTDPYSYNSSCKNKDWLFSGKDEWLISPRPGNTSYAFKLVSGGRVYSNFGASDTASIYPVFYLSKGTTISQGKGTQTDPYILS